MNLFEDKAKEIAKLFPESIKISNYLVEDEFAKFLNYVPDFLLSYHDLPFCPIEIKVFPSINDFFVSSSRASLVNHCLEKSYPFAIIVLNDSCYLLSEDDGYKLHEPIALSEAASIIIARMTVITTTDIGSLAEDFREKLILIAKSITGIREETIAKIAEMTIDDLDWKNIKSSPTIITLSPEFEKKFFIAVLGSYSHSQVCRYTSRSTLNRILTTQKQSVCSIVGMNDKSECYYADNYLAQRRGFSKSAPRSSYALNEYFISSCSRMDTDPNEGSMSDNLTMWRMYAEEGEGVCMIFDIDNDLMNSGYVLSPVSYGKIKDILMPYDVDEEENAMYELIGKEHYHPELDLIYALRFCKVGGYEYRFPNFDFWKHFFKAFEYRDEKEIRLMYEVQKGDKKKWIEGNNIICPVIEKTIEEGKNQFPLILREVILGPKFKEKDVNVFQLSQMIPECNIHKGHEVECRMSEIDNYR